ncbi:MAG: hypothetical protein A4E73_01048 [Syntrophaceae bacterium PtaU1.Bin231]|nr:MAG: hypothetical protein A4E73_01048 [Syntrophaceae bacterium PtaU1.Bin231]HOG18767.1 DUF1178 family protein [Syntrophales bacterium]
MIIFDLRCSKGHTFEGWFRDRAAFDEQKRKKLIECPVCGNSDADVVPSSIAVMGKDARDLDRKQDRELPPLKALQMLHEYITKNFDDVGEKFAEAALKIHRGEEDRHNIRGTTTKREEEMLKEEGVPFFKIPVPKFDS